MTRDAVRITLHANIELPEDAVAVRQVQAAGVGLYRTEFLFMNRTDIPDEEEHLASYLHVIKMLEDRPITIPAVDLGADKHVDGGRGMADGGSGVTGPFACVSRIWVCFVRNCGRYCVLRHSAKCG
ncbi:MAG: putative PEP-binding protein [Candidatus Competibacteraceae bacterium]